MNDPADDPSVVDARLAAGIGWKMWRNLRKLPIRKPKMVPIHRCFLSEAVNHIALLMPTILWVATLEQTPNARQGRLREPLHGNLRIELRVVMRPW
jgi:hypothetical protein